MSNQPGPGIVFGGGPRKPEKSAYRSPVRRTDSLAAIQAQPGMVVPNQDLTAPVASHVILRVEPTEDHIHQLIWTTQSIDGQPFVFRNLEPLGFPRRPNGANHHHRPPCPPPEKLAIGDTLPIIDPNAIPGAAWLVKRITPVTLSKHGEVDITVFHPAYGYSIRRWQLGIQVALPITGGLSTGAPRRRPANTAPDWLPYSGPYLVPGLADSPTVHATSEANAPRHLVMLAEKQGPGRWPSVLAEPDDEWAPEPGLIYRRPPELWKRTNTVLLFAGEGAYSRHSRDPLWGVASKPRRLYMTPDDMAMADRYTALFREFTDKVHSVGGPGAVD